MLYDGLAKLMYEKSFHSITVTDLVETAQVGRATFYRNFDEIGDILHLRSDQVFEELIAYFVSYVQENGIESRTTLLKPLLRYFYLHSEVIELLMKAKRLDIVHSSFRRALEPFKAIAALRYDVDETDFEYVQAIRIGLAINILIHWIETGKKEAPDVLADRLGALLEEIGQLEQLL